MPITINGSTGIAGVDGSASTPAIQGTDTNTGVTFPAADTVAVSTGGSERMRVDANGKVLIGTTTAASGSGVVQTIVGAGSNDGGVQVTSGTGVSGGGAALNSLAGGGLKIFSFTGNAGSESYTEQVRIDNSGNLQFNSGYGSVATAYGCRAWVNFNGTGTVAIRASGNVSSITDGGVGTYTVNITTAMPDVNYAAIAATGTTASNNEGAVIDSRTTTTLRVYVYNSSSALADDAYVAVAVFR